MISVSQIRAGINRGIVRLIEDPNMESGTVCAIGDNWFYFGGETAEETDPTDYLRNVPIEDIAMEIWEALSQFQHDECFSDEYRYYEAVLVENIQETEYERGYRRAFEDINRPMAVVAEQWNPSGCPRCEQSYDDFEPCDDGYYKRATTMERCPFCGQKLDWNRVNW